MSVQRIQQAIRYIEEHLCEDIHYAQVAGSIRMSPYDFHRTFRFIAGMTANEYLRSRRLTLAAQELQSTDIPVIEVAYKYGYESPESFAKAFSRFHGSSPRQARQKGATLRLFGPLVVKMIVEGGTMMDYRLEHQSAQRFILQSRAFSNETMKDADSRSIPDFWGTCFEQGWLDALKGLRPAGKKDLYGLCNPTKSSETHFHYGIGVLVDADTDPVGLQKLLDNGYTLWETGSSDYAVFPCSGPDSSCVSETWSRFYKEFSPQTGYRKAKAADYELYLENKKAGLFCELWIPVERDGR